MSQVIDQKKMVRQVEARLANTTNLRHVQLLKVVRDHLDAESDMDLDALLATVAKDAVYHNWQFGEDHCTQGWNAIRNLYIGALKAGLTIMEFDIERIVVDDNAVVTEGYQYQVAPPEYARACGLEDISDDDVYLHRFRETIIWDFNEAGKMTGESFYYSGGTSGFRKLLPGEIPEAYYRQFEMAESEELAGAGLSMENLSDLVAGSATRH